MLMPGVAPAAIQEGRYVARVIRNRVTGKPALEAFRYWDKGDLAIVGRTYAVADQRIARFSGLPAWAIWAAIHIYSLIGFANRFVVLMRWTIAFLTKQRQVRVIPENVARSGAPNRDGWAVARSSRQDMKFGFRDKEQ